MDRPSLCFHGSACDRQPEAAAGLVRATSLEWFKNSTKFLVRETLTGVAHIEDDVLGGVRHRDIHLTAVCVLDGVLRQVPEHRLSQDGIQEYAQVSVVAD